MATRIKMEIRPEEIIDAVKKMAKRDREEFIEDLLAATSPKYLNSIKEARADYRTGKVLTHDELFINDDIINLFTRKGQERMLIS